jgi:hypothetical protein
MCPADLIHNVIHETVKPKGIQKACSVSYPDSLKPDPDIFQNPDPDPGSW